MRRLLAVLALCLLGLAGRAKAEEPAGTPTPAPTPPIFHDREIFFPPFVWVEPRTEPNGYHSTFHMAMMLWWDADSSVRSYHTLLPFFYQRKDKATDASTTVGILPLPFYWYSSPGSKGFYVPPVYYQWGKEVSRFGVPPIFWYGRVGNEVTHYFFPLYFYDEREGRRLLVTVLGGGWGNKDDFQGFVGPYYWRNSKSPEEFHAHVLFPLFWQASGKDWSTWVAGPAFRSTTSGERGTSEAYGLIPLFYERKGPGEGKTIVTPLSVFERKDKDSSFLVTPLGGYSRSPDRAVTVVGPWYSSRDRDERLSVLFPLFFHGVSGEGTGNRRSWTVLGTYWERHVTWDSPSGSHTWSDHSLLPLFWYGRRDHDVKFLSPVAFWHKHENGDLNGLFGPLFLTDTQKRFGWVLLPGIWYGHGEKVSFTAGAGPLYFVRSRKDNETWTGLVPIAFFHNRLSEDGRHRLLTVLPLFWFSEKPGYLDFISPLYTQIRSPGEHRIMAGWLWWDHWTAGGYRNLTLFPLFHWRREGESRALYTPVGFYEKDPGYHRWLWGVDYHLRDDKRGVHQDVVFPWFWRFVEPGRKILFAFPYYQHREGAYFTESVIPLWYHTEIPGASQSLLIPFFWIRTDTVEKTRLTVTPLFGWYTGPGIFKILLPFVYYADAPGHKTSVFFPFFWWDHDRGRKTLVIPPFFDVVDSDAHSVTTGLVPLFYFHRDPTHTRLLSPGVFFFQEGERRETVALPLLYYWYRDPDRSAGVAGLWWWSKSKSDPTDYFRTLFPLYYEKSFGSRRELATPLFWHHQEAHESWTAALPGFGWATHTDEEGKLDGWNVLAGPVYYRTQKDAGDLVVFPFFWHTHSPEQTITSVFPLFFYRRTPSLWKWVTLGAAAGGDPGLDREWWWVLLAGHVRQGDESKSGIFPLAWWRESPRRFTLATPLFWHDVDKQSGYTRTLGPLFYRATGQGVSSTVLFPLFWDFRNEAAKRQSLGVLPFFFTHTQPDSSWTVIPPLLSVRVRHGADYLGVYGPLITASVEGRKTLALFPLFRWHKDEDGSSFASLPFLWWIVHPDGKSRGFVGVGYWNQETGTRFWLPGYLRVQGHDEAGRVINSTEVAGPFYIRYQSASKDVKVIPPWFQVIRPDGEKIHGVAPFWWSRRGKEDNQPYYHWSLLGDLVGYQKKGDYHRWVFFWVVSTRPKMSRQASLRGLHLAEPSSPIGGGSRPFDLRRHCLAAP